MSYYVALTRALLRCLALRPIFNFQISIFNFRCRAACFGRGGCCFAAAGQATSDNFCHLRARHCAAAARGAA